MLQYLKLYRLILRTFGFTLRPIVTFCLIHLRRLVDTTASAADHVFFRSFKKASVDCPVFILGHPRSGTTLLHRFLSNTHELCAFELWEMLFPSITARKMLTGLVGRMAPLSPARYHSADAHETSLRDVETDDAMAFFRFVDGGFLWSYFFAWEEDWGSEACNRRFGIGGHADTVFDRDLRYLDSCWRRNLYVKRKPRIVVKSSLATMHVARLVARYPDCKIIYLVRDPVEAIPSGMSLLTGVLEKAYDIFHQTNDKARARYLENLYQASCYTYRTFHDTSKSGVVPAENLRIVPYRRLVDAFEGTMRDVFDFIGVRLTPELSERVRRQADAQQRRSSAHRYDLAKFGLSEQRIRKDLAFVYESYGL